MEMQVAVGKDVVLLSSLSMQASKAQVDCDGRTGVDSCEKIVCAGLVPYFLIAAGRQRNNFGK